MRTAIKLTLLFAFVSAHSMAQVPGILSFQGRVTVNGANFDGTGQFKFALVDAGRLIPRPPLPPLFVHTTYWSHDGSSSGGNTPTSSVPVAVSKGLYSVMLGDTVVPGMLQSIPSWVFTNTQVYLRVWFDDGTNGLARLTPDQRIGANAYALKAAGVEPGAVTAEMVADGAVGTTALADGAVTGGKIQAGSLKLSQLDDGGSAAFQRFQEAAQSLDGGTSLVFGDLYPVATTNGSPASLALSVNGSIFGTVIGFSGSEEISRPYSYVVQAQYSGAAVDPNSQIGAAASLIFTRNKRTTTFGGVVTASTVAGSSRDTLLYTLRLEPALAQLGLTTDYRVNQDKTVPAVVSALYTSILGGAPVQSLRGAYTPHTTLMQYAETDLNFFNRLLEYEGIFYFFDQGALPPTLILGDDNSAFPVAPNSPFAYFGDTATNPPGAAEYIQTFQNAVHQSTLRSSANGYNFETPSSSLLGAANSPAGGTGEAYEFGGPGDAVRAYNTTLAKVRAERQATERSAIAGSGLVPDVRAGYAFVLADQIGAGLGNTYLVTSVRHAAFARITNGVTTCFYGNRFEAIPASVPFRPALRAPRPQAQSCTAVVTGPAGEEIYADKYGRVKVQFHWDRYGVRDQNSSAWLRVASPWAGNAFGVVFLPRIGHEVLVDFIQGNPDQPVIVGSLYNAQMTQPYSLPANQTVSTIKSRSSKGGTPDNFNEIKFDDRKGSESLQISAEKDFVLGARNNMSVSGGNDVFFNVARDVRAAVGNDSTLTVNHNLTLGAASSLSLTGSTFSVTSAQNSFSGPSAFAGPVAVWNGVQAYSTFTMNQNDLYLKDDDKHGLGYYGGAKTFAGMGTDGPVLYGYSGGALGTRTFTASTVALNWNNSGNVSVGSTNAPASTLDVYGTATVRGNLVVSGSISNASPFYGSGSLLGTRSIIVNAPSVVSVAANTWTKVGDIGSFTKSAAGSVLEITFNGRLAVASWGTGASGANFELRVDNVAVSSGVARATVVTSDNPNFGVSASMTGIFTGLGVGSHTVSIWVYSYNGTAGYPTVNPGNFTAPHVVVKEFK